MADKPRVKRVHRSVDHVYDGMVMMDIFPPSSLDRIKQTEFDDKDVIVVSYPKCGTTWLQEIVYLINTNGDFEASDKIPLFERSYFIEANDYFGSEIERCLNDNKPRYIKSHLPKYFFDKTLEAKKTKFVAIFRNPKDMLVSYYHFHRMCVFDFDVDGTWDEFFEKFRNNKISHGNYFDLQLSYWRIRDDPRLLILKYEDMLKDLEGAIRKVATHLEKDISDELVSKIAKRTTFSSMKSNPMLNFSTVKDMQHEVSPFMRKGCVGDWRNYFSEEQSRFVDNLVETRFKPEGLYLADD